jgi:outer membrane lipoprotein-sorting protein
VKSKLAVFLLTAALILSACAPAGTESPSATQAPEEAETVSTVEAEADECLACHTDKQRLIDTAKPVDAAESESKGVG